MVKSQSYNNFRLVLACQIQAKMVDRPQSDVERHPYLQTVAAGEKLIAELACPTPYGLIQRYFR